MNQKTFYSLLRYYLSCIDAEEAVHLQLKKDQEYKTYIWLEQSSDYEVLFTEATPKLDIELSSPKQNTFLEKRSADKENIQSLYYGFPVFNDEKDILCPLFFIEVNATISNQNNLALLSEPKSFAVNRMHFSSIYGAEEAQKISDGLEGDFGSFSARLEAAAKYIPSLKKGEQHGWINKPILFRTNLNSSRSGIRYDLTHLLNDKNALSKETALTYFLRDTEDNHEPETPSRLIPPILETGALNPQQEEAVQKGLTKNLSVIKGPPGTGKTQVVTALLASAVYNNETVLFASNNNMPVDGVYERLGQSTGELGNWQLRLGNKEKTQLCHETITTLLQRLETSPHETNIGEHKDKFYELEIQIGKALASLEKAKQIQQEITDNHNQERAIENELPEGWVEQFIDSDPTTLNDQVIRKLKKLCRKGLILWLRQKFTSIESYRNKFNKHLEELGAGHALKDELNTHKLYNEAWTDAINQADRTLANIKRHQDWTLCIEKRRNLEAKLLRHATAKDLYDLKIQKTDISQKLFALSWLNNIMGKAKDASLALKLYFKDIEDYRPGRHKRIEKSLNSLAHFFPIWITTNQSASSTLPPQPAIFDLLVIDEAGQCDIPSIIPLFYRAKRAVIIGDPQQFQHITSLKSKIEEKIAKDAGALDLMNDWSFTSRSAFDRAEAATPYSTLLKQHYRCHPDIIEFSNQSFYEGELVEQAPLKAFINKLPIQETGLIWHNTSGNVMKAKSGAWNPNEVSKTVEVLEGWAKHGLFADPHISYGVVTPFRQQVIEMRKALSKCAWFGSVEERFTIGTAHSFQGSECDVLIYSPVVASGMEDYLINFAAGQKDLINVTVTRAKSLLYIIGDLDACRTLSTDMSLNKLAEYAENIKKQQRHPLNAAEKAMANILEDLNLSYSTQHQLGQYRLDFLVNANSGDRYDVEVDGDIHLSAAAVEHDDRRDAFVESKNLKILRFAARDVVNNAEIIKERLARI